MFLNKIALFFGRIWQLCKQNCDLNAWWYKSVLNNHLYHRMEYFYQDRTDLLQDDLAKGCKARKVMEFQKTHK